MDQQTEPAATIKTPAGQYQHDKHEVHDAEHEFVCTCVDSKTAAAIVAALNKLARIEAAAQADADDLEQMRDGTKLTRSGIVSLLAFQQEDIAEEEARKERDAAVRRHERVSILSANRGIYLSEYFDSVTEAGIDVEFQDGDEVTGAPEKLLEWVKATKSQLTTLRTAAERLWQPIETAPKEGRFLVAADNGVVDVVEPHNCNGWVYGPKLVAPIRADATIGNFGTPEYKITHWMPMPTTLSERNHDGE